MGKAGTHWARSRLAVYALLLASAVILGGGVALAFLDKDLDSSEIASAIGLNLIASVLFALIFSYISGTIQERLLLERIEGSISKVSQELFVKLAGYQDHYMPTITYGAGEQWQRAYNDDVTASLLESASYAFRGTSAKYVASRLRRVPRGKLRRIDIVMLDPRSDQALQARADIKQAQTRTSKEVSELAEEIKNEILLSVVALFDFRHSHELKIAFVANVAATRIELFDDAAYISWYQGPESADKPFPESLKFTKGTFPYEVQAQEVHLSKGLAGYTMEITRNTNQADLLRHLEELARRPVTPGDVQAWREEHAKLVEDFEKFLDQR